MRKFPVTSVNGNEYLVEAEFTNYLVGDVLSVKVYIKTDYKFLWKNKTKFVEVFGTYYEKGETKYHNIVEAIKHTIKCYERKIQKKLDEEALEKELLKSSARELEEWNGECK